MSGTLPSIPLNLELVNEYLQTGDSALFSSIDQFAYDEYSSVIKDLKEGGKLILIRHSDAPGTGDPSYFNLNDCKTQRNLSAEGIEQAKRIGEFFKRNNISFEKVYSSEYCRCKDTARNAFKDFETFSGLNSTFADSSKTPAYMKKTKEFIEKLDKNKNYIFVVGIHFYQKSYF